MFVARRNVEIMLSEKIDKFVESFLSPSNNDHLLFKHLKSEDGKLKLYGSLDELKSFIEDNIGLQGDWSSPGDSAKKFVCKANAPDVQFSITWYSKKQCFSR